jgi:D-alanyl-D-alanine carboxypeptidase/D-alanyl-D-alanine-endopeptidase (penicillin-binding protein 4)
VTRALAALLAASGAVCCWLGVRPPADASTRPGAGDEPALGSPLWSPRRAPQAFVHAVGARNLQLRLDELAAGAEACFRVAVDGLGTVAEGGGEAALVPASTEKLFTAAGALGALGPDFRFETAVVAGGAPRAGTVERLWLVGGGDPTLSTPEWIARLAAEPRYAGLTETLTPLAGLADAIVAAGIRAIPGGITGDGSRYDTPPYLGSWPDSYRDDVGPLGALVVDDGFDPLTGEPVGDPALAAAAALARLLVARGVAVGPASVGTPPEDAAHVASVPSAELPALVTALLSASDNGTAEALALEVDLADGGSGTTAGGVAEITERLRSFGVDTTGVHLVDASGLSRENRATCPALLQTLELAARPELRVLVGGNAIAGARGTLRERFVGTPIQGRFRGKTGSLSGVAGIVGVFDADAGEGSPRLSAVYNGPFGEAGGVALTSAAVDAAFAFPQSPPAEQLVPPP